VTRPHSGLVYSGLVYSGLVYSGLVYSGLVYSGLVYSGLVYSGRVVTGTRLGGLVGPRRVCHACGKSRARARMRLPSFADAVPSESRGHVTDTAAACDPSV
jgi:hypothetical protein